MSGETLILWSVVCFGLALVLFLVELFIPSGGLIGIAASICLIAGVMFLFKINTQLGLIGAIVCLAALPFGAALVIKVWPQTPIARMLTLQNPEPRSVDAPAEGPQQSQVKIGAVGQALTELRPVGACLIDGHRLDCLAERGLIPAGSKVRVVQIDGMQIKVRPDSA